MEQSFYEFAKSEFTSRYQLYKSSLPFDTSEWKKSTFIRALWYSHSRNFYGIIEMVTNEMKDKYSSFVSFLEDGMWRRIN